MMQTLSEQEGHFQKSQTELKSPLLKLGLHTSMYVTDIYEQEIIYALT